MADSSTKPAYLDPSELGTKEYWDALYQTELSNHAANPHDTGTVWFDDSDVEAKLVAFLTAHGPALGIRLAAAALLDLGCGNGSLLFALRDAGFAGRCLGVDYSAASVALARQVGASRGISHRSSGSSGSGGSGGGGDNDIDFAAWDILAGPLAAVLAGSQAGGWDVVLDKGTFDAVSLSGERDGAGRRVCEGYRERVLSLLKVGGCFLVTSCNWTEGELRSWFEGEGESESEGGRLEQVGRVQYPSFSFGGIKGQTISTVCFMKKV